MSFIYVWFYFVGCMNVKEKQIFTNDFGLTSPNGMLVKWIEKGLFFYFYLTLFLGKPTLITIEWVTTSFSLSWSIWVSSVIQFKIHLFFLFSTACVPTMCRRSSKNPAEKKRMAFVSSLGITESKIISIYYSSSIIGWLAVIRWFHQHSLSYHLHLILTLNTYRNTAEWSHQIDVKMNVKTFGFEYKISATFTSILT